MRFLRMLANALIAGALGAAYLTILVLQLNPQLPLPSRSAVQWYVTLGALYGLYFALGCYGLMLLRAFFSVETFSPAWVSVRLLAWLWSAAAAAAALLMWLNLHGLSAALHEDEAHRLAVGASATTVAAVVLCGIAVAHYSFGRRGSRVGAGLLAIAITASLALPLAARGRGGAEAAHGAARVSPPGGTVLDTGPHVRMMLLDGASLAYIWPRAAEGRLPNFGRLLDGGASMDLATIRPTQPDPVWVAVATGMFRAKNGVRSAASYAALDDNREIDLLPDDCFSHTLVQLGIVRQVPKTSSAWRARPLWALLNDYGITAGIVRWPLTYPADPIRGFVVSDRVHQLLGTMAEIDGRATFPDDLQDVVHEAFEGSEAPATVLPGNIPVPSRTGADVTSAKWDQYYARALRAAARARPVQFTAMRYQGLDVVGHAFLRSSQQAFGADETDDDRDAAAAVLDRYYAYIDGEVGAAIDALQPGDLLLVVSGFGMEPVGPAMQIANRLLRQPDVSGTRSRPTGSCSRTARRCSAASGRAARSSTSRRRCSISWAFRSAATWTASRGPISSPRNSPPTGPSRSFLRTTQSRIPHPSSGIPNPVDRRNPQSLNL